MLFLIHRIGTTVLTVKCSDYSDYQGPDFDDMSSFFSCEIEDTFQYINLRYGAQAPN